MLCVDSSSAFTGDIFQHYSDFRVKSIPGSKCCSVFFSYICLFTLDRKRQSKVWYGGVKLLPTLTPISNSFLPVRTLHCRVVGHVCYLQRDGGSRGEEMPTQWSSATKDFPLLPTSTFICWPSTFSGSAFLRTVSLLIQPLEEYKFAG